MVCEACAGKGGSNVKSCTGCKGRGIKIQMIQVGTVQLYRPPFSPVSPVPPASHVSPVCLLTHPFASQMGPGMVQQSQVVCSECEGKGEIIPPSSRWGMLGYGMVWYGMGMVWVGYGGGGCGTKFPNNDTRCKSCKGKKTTKEKKVIEIELDKGCPSDFRKVGQKKWFCNINFFLLKNIYL